MAIKRGNRPERFFCTKFKTREGGKGDVGVVYIEGKLYKEGQLDG